MNNKTALAFMQKGGFFVIHQYMAQPNIEPTSEMLLCNLHLIN